MTNRTLRISLAGSALLLALTGTTPASAHCDTTGGPVVSDARAALDAEDPRLVLHWVRPEDEAAVERAFAQALAVRALGPQAAALADTYFFETLVRVHRAGEGAPYTGLKNEDPEPIIAATDRALESGSPSELERALVADVRAGLAARFEAARSARGFGRGEVTEGREFVADYVSLTHWVEGVSTAARGAGEHHATSEDHEAAGHAADAHGGSGHAQHVPWVLSGLFGIVALFQGGLLLRRRMRAAV